MVNVDLYLYQQMHDAYDAKYHKLEGLDKTSLEITK